MRRMVLFLAGFLLALVIVGCGGIGKESATTTTSATATEESQQASGVLGRSDRLLIVTSKGALASVRPDGTDLKTISRLGGYAELSPDRRLLAVSHDDGSLTVRRIHGGRGHVVARDAGPWTWAPDNRRIAYSAESEGVEQIYVARVDGTQRRQISHNTRPTSGKYFSPYHLLRSRSAWFRQSLHKWIDPYHPDDQNRDPNA